jgi:hypothetical protein
VAASAGFPHTIQAVRAAAELVQWAWVQLAESSALTRSDRATYVAGLTSAQSLVHPLGGDPLKATVINTAEDAPRIEHGFAAYHLPSRIDWGAARSARLSRAGRYYMAIPFRHAATRYGRQRGELRPAMRRQMLTERVYRLAQHLRPEQHLTAGRARGRGVHAPGLTPYRPAFARNVRPGYAHAAREERLVRRPGRSARQSQYLTFRTMTADSPGWWIPGKPGVELARQAQRDTAPAVRAMIEAGVRADIVAALRPQTGG